MQTSWIDHPSGYLALSDRNSFFVGDSRSLLPESSPQSSPRSSPEPSPKSSPDPTAGFSDDGFIAYRRHGRHLFVFGGVHAPPMRREALLDAFLENAQAQRLSVVVVQLRASQIDLFARRGFTVNRFGTSFGLRLDSFRLSGTRRMKLRNKIGRARRLGLRVCEVGRELPKSPQTFAALDAISGHWLRRKGKKELDFMIGELGPPEDPRRRIFVVLGPPAGERSRLTEDASEPDERTINQHNNHDKNRSNSSISFNDRLHDTWLGFITYVPVFGACPGYLHDLTRRLPAAPPGAMELCNAEAMARLHAEGAAFLHFGFTPFVVDSEDPLPPSVPSSPWLSRAVRLLYRHGRLIYPAQSQAEYKRKWGPDLIEPEYVAARPLSLRAIWDLLRVTRSL